MQSVANPFLNDVFVGDLSELAGGAASGELTVEKIHRDALRKLGGLVAHLGSGGGEVILLSSAQAGFGKSHLLSRLVADQASDCFFIPVELNRDSRPNWVGLLQAVLGACTRPRQALPQVSYLEEMSRRLMAVAAADLILRGDVPAGDPAAAISMLKRDYMRAFDMRGGGSEVARWMDGNFNALLPLMAGVLARRAMVEADEAEAWMRVLSRFNRGDAAERKAAIASVAMLGVPLCQFWGEAALALVLPPGVASPAVGVGLRSCGCAGEW